MMDARVEIPSADQVFFQQLCAQNSWTFNWIDGTDRPDYVEDD